MIDERHRIVHVALDEKTVVRRKPEVEHERAVAIFDLIEDNYFRPLECPDDGPFHLNIGIADNRLNFDIHTQDGRSLQAVPLPLSPFRSIVRDYLLVCNSYYQAITGASLAQIEAIDMGRRGLHNEGSEMLRAQLAKRIDIDLTTARRLFTLVCVLHIRG